MSEKTNDSVVGIEMLAQWEGPAEHAPGVLFGESPSDGLLGGETSLVELASWVALAATSGTAGNTDSESIKAKVLEVLTAFRQRTGQAKLDEVKQLVFDTMKQHARNGKLTEDELQKRIDGFFAEMR